MMGSEEGQRTTRETCKMETLLVIETENVTRQPCKMDTLLLELKQHVVSLI